MVATHWWSITRGHGQSRPVTGDRGRRRSSRPHLMRLCLAISLLVATVTATSMAIRTSPASASPPHSWRQLFPVTSEESLSSASIAYDPAIAEVVLFGGIPQTTSNPGNETWVFDGSTWTELSPSTSPSPRNGASMVYDPAIGKLVLFSGAGGPPNDTWTFDGTTWSQLSPATSPPPMTGESMVYDSAIGEVVLFGGLDFANRDDVLNETWTFDGSTWTDLDPLPTSPPPLLGASMVYDPTLGQVVLFGGSPNGGGESDETWSFDGTTWTQLSPTTSPPATTDASMVYDSATGLILLFSGLSSCDCNDTWTYDGTTWTQLSPDRGPTARFESSMVYDAAMGTVLLYGGYQIPGQVPLGDTWIFGQLVITTTSLPQATRGVPYDSQIQASGGLMPFHFRRISGTLPKGVRMSTSGLISGTPNLKKADPGAYTFTVQVKDSVTGRGGGKQLADQTLTLNLS
jgi:hypothetical protein